MKKLTLTLFALILLTGFTAPNGTKTVYICTGPKAQVYHSSATCRGMSRCSEEIKAISLTNAEKWNDVNVRFVGREAND